MELSWVQGAWNHCPLSIRFTFLYSLYSASYSEVMAWGGALRRSKGSGKHLLKVITSHYPEVEITPQQQTEKRKGKGCSGFQKKQLTSSQSLLGRCVSAESRYCPQKSFGADVQPALLQIEGWAPWRALFLLLCCLEVKVLTKQREKPLGSWQLLLSYNQLRERGLNYQIRPQDRMTWHARND